jgi:predicted kinase
MSEKVLILTVGLPRSGKTTWAKTWGKDNGCPIVNPDSVRLAIHGRRFESLAEGFVWATARAMVRALFLAGHDAIIVDATNTTRKRRDEWRSPDWRTVCHVFDTAKEVCVERASADGDSEILPVIKRMAGQWEPLGEDEERIMPLGATGQFPDGSYRDDPQNDEGELQIAIAADVRAKLVRVKFGKPVGWLALPGEQAVALGNLLIKRSKEVQ